ncbi:MAG TPA: DUF2497 domain-containing protein [Hyphomicrobiaceae bacterium]|nr:DUF2497 domain-containing protein [Hyphomicrobiaceae bacterium]
MQRSPKATEQSLDEILASIRKIIAEDPANATPPPPPAPPRSPGPPPVGGSSPSMPLQRSQPESGSERRKTTDLEADLADLLGSITPRPGTNAPPAQAAAEAKGPSVAPARSNGNALASTAPQRHRPLMEVLNRARAERAQQVEGVVPPPALPVQTVRAAPPPSAPVERDAPSGRPPSTPAPASSVEPRQAEPGKEAEPGTADAAAPVNATEVRAGASEPASANAPAPPDAVAAAAAAVARKVAATMPSAPVTARPFMAARSAQASGEGGRTLEETVADLLRPMLRQWLDANMPRIVEKALKTELAERGNTAKGSTGSEQG